MTAPLQLETGMLSFERSLQISEALMAAVFKDGKTKPIAVTTKGVRGQTYNHMPIADRVSKNAGDSNIQTVETASMPPESIGLQIGFSLRVMPGSTAPHACNNAAITESYKRLSQRYAEEGGYTRLAERYVWNLCNGSFAWRNAYQVDSASVQLTWGAAADQTVTLRDVARIGTDTPVAMNAIAALDSIGGDLHASDVEERLNDLVASFAKSLHTRNTKPLTIQVVWTGETQEGQEVFPSQEFLNETAQRENKDKLARVLAKIGDNKQASIHSQKIGAALRRIDTWHGHPSYGAIVVNAYSGVQETGEVLRGGRSFYEMRAETSTLFDSDRQDELDFVVANLVRGGVFGVKNETKPEKGKGPGKKTKEG